VDDDVSALVRDERLVEAAEHASARGDHRTASALFERACVFHRAAKEALSVGDVARALTLAVQANDAEFADQALARVASETSAATRLAHQFELRGENAWAARIFEAVGARTDAARAFERAGNAIAAARLHEAEGDVARAARALEQALRSQPDHAGVRLALGELLLRHGKAEAATRHLQGVPPGSLERRAALTHLEVALKELGFHESARHAHTELAALGGPVAPRPEASEGSRETRSALQPRLLGRYRVNHEIASSPHARIFECFDEARGDRVAVKVFAGFSLQGEGRDALARFQREAKALGALVHPHIVPLRDASEEGPTLVMDWMGGGTLEPMLASGFLSPARAVEIALAVLDALREAHRLGILHRDVKPSNVLFDEAGVARLGDFGVAHLSDTSATATAGWFGSLAYMSPEQRRGQPATIQSDGYAVGVMLWEMLTGALPAWSDGREDATGTTPDRPWPSDRHRDLDARHDGAVLSMLHPEAEARPLDARAAMDVLRNLAWPSTVDAPKAKLDAAQPTKSTPSDKQEAGTSERPPTDDPWLSRRTRLLPLNDASLARARAFAQADHACLPLIVRVDTARQGIVVVEPTGRPLETLLRPDEASKLCDALHKLHTTGNAYGHLRREHVFRDAHGHVTLAFTLPDRASFDEDLASLDALTRLDSPPG
jgi:serine/threonine protein kinase